MTERVCKTCARPLIEEDGEYCPHCNAKRAGKVGKAGSVISAAVTLIVGGIFLKIFNKK